jgi:hypothetical protein
MTQKTVAPPVEYVRPDEPFLRALRKLLPRFMEQAPPACVTLIGKETSRYLAAHPELGARDAEEASSRIWDRARTMLVATSVGWAGPARPLDVELSAAIVNSPTLDIAMLVRKLLVHGSLAEGLRAEIQALQRQLLEIEQILAAG